MKDVVKKALAAVFAATALASGPVFAQGWYLDLGLGQAKLGTSATELSGVAGTSLDNKDRAIALRAGMRLHPNFALELGYYDFGEYRYDGLTGANEILLPLKLTGRAKARSLGVSLAAIASVERFDLYARLGYARSELKTRAEVEGFIGSGTLVDPRTRRDNEFFGGVGARFNVGRQLGLFAEYQKHDKLDIDAWLAGVDFRF